MLFMNRFSTIFLILISLIVSACSYSYNYSYTLINKSSNTVNVYFESYDFDSIYTIEASQSQILLITTHGKEAKGGPFYGDVNTDIIALNISMYDTLLSAKN